MPKTIIYTANLASGGTSSILTGDVNEFIPQDSVVRITAVSSATGIKMDVFADTDLLVDRKEIPFIGTSLIDKDHVIDEFEVEAGTKLTIRLNETASVATTDIYVGVEITPSN